MSTTQDKSSNIPPIVTITSGLEEKPNGDMVSGIKVNINEYKVLIEAEYVRKLNEKIGKIFPTVSNRTGDGFDADGTGTDTVDADDDNNIDGTGDGFDADGTDIDAKKAIQKIQNYLLGNAVDDEGIDNTGRIEEFSKVIESVKDRLNADINSIEKYIQSKPSSNQNTGTNMTDNNHIGTAIAMAIAGQLRGNNSTSSAALRSGGGYSSSIQSRHYENIPIIKEFYKYIIDILNELIKNIVNINQVITNNSVNSNNYLELGILIKNSESIMNRRFQNDLNNLKSKKSSWIFNGGDNSTTGPPTDIKELFYDFPKDSIDVYMVGDPRNTVLFFADKNKSSGKKMKSSKEEDRKPVTEVWFTDVYFYNAFIELNKRFIEYCKNMLDDKFYLYGDIFLTLHKLDRINSSIDNKKIPKGLITDKQKNIIQNVINNKHKQLGDRYTNKKTHVDIYKEFNGSISNDKNDTIDRPTLEEQFNLIDDNKLSEKMLFTFFDKKQGRQLKLEEMLNIDDDLKSYTGKINELQNYVNSQDITISEMLYKIKNDLLNDTTFDTYVENIIKERIIVPIIEKQNSDDELDISDIIENSFEMKLILLSYIYKKSVVMFVRPKSETNIKMLTRFATGVLGENRDILTLKIDGNKDGNNDEDTIYLYRNIKNRNYLLTKKNDTSSSQDPTTNGFFEILKIIETTF